VRRFQFVSFCIFSGFVPDAETLHNAAYNGLTQAVRAILSVKDFKPDVEALHFALEQGHVDIGKLLIEHGVKPDQVGGKTVLLR
jgi:hypothetical protein